MKHVKRLTSLLLALVMVVALSVSAMATTITIKDEDATGSTYVAYKLLNATNATTTDEEGKTVATDKFAYTLNEKYTAVLKEVTGKTTEADIIDYISNLKGDAVQTFADNVYAKVKTMAVDATASDKVFASVAQGYYLIAETVSGAHPDTASLVMLDTAGQEAVEVETKEDAPTVEKKVKDTNDTTGETSEWQDSADYDIGDEIPYQITGTVSSKIASYKEYYYKFTDTMTHLTYKDGTAEVTVDGVDVTEKFEIKWDADKKILTAECKDLTKAATLSATSKVVLTYTATLDTGANIGPTGNPNEVKLTYSNNPYHEGDGTPTNDTPPDKNIVFTYKAVVNKVDGQNQPLKGAGFTLYKFDKEANDYVEYKNKLTLDTTIEGDKAGTVFTAKGLDDGKYKIVETTVPAGYNKAADIEFTITATHQEKADEPELLTLTVDHEKVTAVKDTGTVSTDVVNNSGTELPSTGGVGTTLFYVVGGILVVAAGILLISKKRTQD